MQHLFFHCAQCSVGPTVTFSLACEKVTYVHETDLHLFGSITTRALCAGFCIVICISSPLVYMLFPIYAVVCICLCAHACLWSQGYPDVCMYVCSLLLCVCVCIEFVCVFQKFMYAMKSFPLFINCKQGMLGRSVQISRLLLVGVHHQFPTSPQME